MKKNAVGILIKDRWALTQKCLQSLYHTDQSKDSYDLYLIDNGSSPDVSGNLKEWARSGLIPVKNLIRIPEVSMSKAWNLFLGLTKNYLYRTKLDNDMIFANTPVSLETKTSQKPITGARPPSPGDAGANPGAIPVAGFIIGAGKIVNKNTVHSRHTCFLQYMEEAIVESKLGICSLVPLMYQQTLAQGMQMMGQKIFRGQKCLVGACMMITKDTFAQLGYFDESLPCSLDLEYSQRAMAASISAGYVDKYYVLDAGYNNSTLSQDIKQMHEQTAKQLAQEIPFQRPFVSTSWQKSIENIRRIADDNVIVDIK